MPIMSAITQAVKALSDTAAGRIKVIVRFGLDTIDNSYTPAWYSTFAPHVRKVRTIDLHITHYPTNIPPLFGRCCARGEFAPKFAQP